MIMMLPFLTAAFATWLGIRGRRRSCIWAWFITLIIYAAWCKYHMTDSLGFSL